MPKKGLYAITAPRVDCRTRLEEQVSAALRGGARLVQYRDKSNDNERRRREAAYLRKLCHAHAVPLIINDDVELAREVGSDGVHLGANDPRVDAARAALGPTAIVGVSCYGEPERAFAAQALGASYVAFGSFFASPTKPEASRVQSELIVQIRNRIRIPIVAIGGISPENGASLLACGVDMLAVISGLFHRIDVESAARDYASLFPDPSAG